MTARPDLTTAAPALAGIPAALLVELPAWCLVVLVVLSALLAALDVTVTQILRLRAGARSPAPPPPGQSARTPDQPLRP